MADEKTTSKASDEQAATTEKTVTRRQPSRIPSMLADKDPERVAHEIHTTYGFMVTDQFAADFVAFVEKAMKGDYAND